jgi:NADH:ubiquinone oxidoreductase subunit F (NADH-binding)
MAVTAMAPGYLRAGPTGPRLLPPAAEDLRAHLARHGPVPYRGGAGLLIPDVRAAGLTGRGGAGFPAHRKLAIVAAARGRKVVVGNGAESEPASRKDAVLLRDAPHLVLDGLQLAAEATGAAAAVLYLHRGGHAAVLRAVAERQAAGVDRLPVTIAEAPPRFLAGQETALVSRVGGGPALPRFGLPRVSERGVAGAPTCVHNVETLAHLALIARHGPRWFRAAGTAAEPGTMLTTTYEAAADGKPRCLVAEAPIGTPLADLLPGLPGAQALLVGGFHGTWLPARTAATLTLDNQALGRHGAALGAGVLAALPAGRCGLAEAARVTRYLAAESAGQCGPCLNGLPRIAAAMAELAGPRPRRTTREDAERWAGLVTGRGACHHPDGTARFVRSALAAFAPELSRHAGGQCSAPGSRPFLPLPDGMPAAEDDWM